MSALEAAASLSKRGDGALSSELCSFTEFTLSKLTQLQRHQLVGNFNGHTKTMGCTSNKGEKDNDLNRSHSYNKIDSRFRQLCVRLEPSRRT